MERAHSHLLTKTQRHDLVLRGVSFAYGPHSEPVLRNLTLTVPAGDHLAVVGPSGIGKSTLAGLLCGMLRPNSGTVEIGGVVAAELPPDRLAEMRTLIPQEAYVFTGTVWDNLTYLCPTATPRQVDNAVAALAAGALITRLGGVSAQLSPAELSAGERQLVAAVRAYLSPAPVVVLDEATCHLDPAAERRVEEAFAARPGTLIVIAHRVSSALRARRILVLDGTGAAVGDHLTLLATSPLYGELLGHWEVVPDEAAVLDEPVEPPVPELVLAAVGAGALTTDNAASSNGACPAPAIDAISAVSGGGSRPWIFGQVRDGGGAALVGATLTLTDLSGRQLDRDVSDEGGHYRLGPPSGGSYLVICASGAHQPTAALVAVADLPVRHDVVLSGVASRVQVAGVVRSATAGLPVAEALATLIAADGQVVGSVITDAQGGFVFDGVSAGVYTVIATGYPPVAAEVSVGLSAPAETVITLRPPTVPDAAAGNGAGSDAAAGNGAGRDWLER